MLKERDQSSGNTNHLSWSNIHECNIGRIRQLKVSLEPRDDVSTKCINSDNLTVDDFGIRRSNEDFCFLIGSQPTNFVSDLSFFDHRVRRDQESIIIHARINRETGNQTNVRAFRCLNRANTTVVRNVNIANLKARTLSIQTTRAQRRQTSLVSQLGKRVRLVNDLRQFTATEKVLNRCRNTLWIDKAPRSHVFLILKAHPLLNSSTKLQETFSKLIRSQLIDRSQTSVTQVINIIDMSILSVDRKLKQITHGREDIIRTKRHLFF